MHRLFCGGKGPFLPFPSLPCFTPAASTRPPPAAPHPHAPQNDFRYFSEAEAKEMGGGDQEAGEHGAAPLQRACAAACLCARWVGCWARTWRCRGSPSWCRRAALVCRWLAAPYTAQRRADPQGLCPTHV